MSTDRIEIKPDTPKETRTLEQSAEDLKKDGIDVSKDVAVNQHGETATLTEKKQEDLQKSSEDITYENEKRPEWLPEKFKNAEELSKAYTELEKQYSGRKEEKAGPPLFPPRQEACTASPGIGPGSKWLSRPTGPRGARSQVEIQPAIEEHPHSAAGADRDTKRPDEKPGCPRKSAK